MNQGAFEANEQIWHNQVLFELRGIKAALNNVEASLRINQHPQPETSPCKHEWVPGFNQRTGERGMVCRKCQKGRRIRRVR
jgi:hypothetical protein